MDQVPCDSDCLADRRLSGFDNRIRDIRLALGCVNGLTGRFAAIYSTSKPDTGTIPDAHSHRSACNESNTDSYTDADAVTKSSAYSGAPSDSSTPPPIANLRGDFKNSIANLAKGQAIVTLAAFDKNPVLIQITPHRISHSFLRQYISFHSKIQRVVELGKRSGRRES